MRWRGCRRRLRAAVPTSCGRAREGLHQLLRALAHGKAPTASPLLLHAESTRQLPTATASCRAAPCAVCPCCSTCMRAHLPQLLRMQKTTATDCNVSAMMGASKATATALSSQPAQASGVWTTAADNYGRCLRSGRMADELKVPHSAESGRRGTVHASMPRARRCAAGRRCCGRRCPAKPPRTAA